jgi:hypothetical protein
MKNIFNIYSSLQQKIIKLEWLITNKFASTIVQNRKLGRLN